MGIALSGRLLGYDRGYRKMFPSDRAGFAGGASLIQPELTGKDLLMPFGKADSLALALKEAAIMGQKPLCLQDRVHR